MTFPLNDFTDHLHGYEVVLLGARIASASEVSERSSELPTDSHIVLWRDLVGNMYMDVVRAYGMAEIFDAYFDYGLRVEEIRNGFGSIKPKLWDASTKIEFTSVGAS